MGIRYQGILPANQHEIANRLAAIISTQFLAAIAIEKRVSDPALLKRIMPMIEVHIDDFLRNKLKKEMPVVSMFIGDKTISSLKQVFVTELETLFPQIMASYATNLLADLNIEHMVKEKISSVSIEDLERLFFQNLRKQIRLAFVLSAVLGLVIGSLAALVILLVK